MFTNAPTVTNTNWLRMRRRNLMTPPIAAEINRGLRLQRQRRDAVHLIAVGLAAVILAPNWPGTHSPPRSFWPALRPWNWTASRLMKFRARLNPTVPIDQKNAIVRGSTRWVLWGVWLITEASP